MSMKLSLRIYSWFFSYLQVETSVQRGGGGGWWRWGRVCFFFSFHSRAAGEFSLLKKSTSSLRVQFQSGRSREVTPLFCLHQRKTKQTQNTPKIIWIKFILFCTFYPVNAGTLCENVNTLFHSSLKDIISGTDVISSLNTRPQQRVEVETDTACWQLVELQPQNSRLQIHDSYLNWNVPTSQKNEEKMDQIR